MLSFCLLPVNPGLAQTIALSHQAWSTEEGLRDTGGVHQILQSADGYLWLATEGGAARFDGATFLLLRHETEPAFTSNDISSIAQDSNGSLWFGTADGLVKSDGSSFRRFSEQDGLPSATILSLAASSDGVLLVLTSAGLAQREGSRFRTLPDIGAAVSSVARVQDGSLKIFSDRGMYTLRGGLLATPKSSAPESGEQAGPDGRLCVWTDSQVSLEDGSRVRNLRTGKELPGGRVNAVLVDADGVAWIGLSHGLFRLARGANAKPEPIAPLQSDSVLSLLEDREGNLWIGTESSGLHTLRPRAFRGEPAAANERVVAVVTAADGTPWFGTRDSGIFAIRHGSAQAPPVELTSKVVLSLVPGAHNDLWVGTPDGLNHLQGNAAERFTSANGLPDDFVRSLLVDARGSVWAGTRRGLVRLERGVITTFTRSDGLGSDSIGPLLDSRAGAGTANDLWIGTAAGLSHLHDGRMESFVPPAPANAIVTALAQDASGAVWAGLHDAGLSRFSSGRFTPIRAPGLPTEIDALVLDRDNFLWIRTLRGVYRAPLAALSRCADTGGGCDAPLAYYGAADGLPSDSIAGEGSPALWLGKGGELWLATRRGIAIADLPHLHVNTLPPPVVIERFIVDDLSHTLSTDALKIESGHRRYVFEYAGLSYTLPAKNHYRYMLEGFDRGWVDAGTTRTASYTSLPPRHYRFRVQAANNDGVWNESGAALAFQILPPFYRRWWFYVLVAAAAGLLIFAILRLRERAVQRRFNLVLDERNRMAREIHDTLAQDFVSVSLQIDLAAQMLKANKTMEAATQLQHTRKLVKEGLEAARQSIWNLRANTAQDSLPTRLSALVRRSGSATLETHLRMGGAYRKLAQSLEDEVLRIAQEGLSNIVRHANASRADIELHYDRDKLLLKVRDNGHGFSAAEASRRDGHYGLQGMRERAATLDALLTIASEPGQGTSLSLMVPIAVAEEAQVL